MDTLIFLAPLALYVKMGTFNIMSTALLTFFFKGLLELSKSFLDPFGREGYRAHNIRVDVLVSEMNFGAGIRWVAAGDALPSDLLERNESIQTTQADPPSTSDGVTTEVRDNVQGSGNLSGAEELNDDSSGGVEGSDTGALHDTDHLSSS